MFFNDRRDAGKRLQEKLLHYRNCPGAVVIGLPRGGVPVAYEVAKGLDLPLDITCPHKIGAPFNPEYAIGAITEHGEGIFNEEVIKRLGISKEYLAREVKERTREARERLQVYRNDPRPREVKGETVILVDDGLATGSTMKAAISSMREEGAARIVVAIPVSPPETLYEIERLADEVICLYAPENFAAVGQFYREFSATSDEEVIELLRERSISG